MLPNLPKRPQLPDSAQSFPFLSQGVPPLGLLVLTTHAQNLALFTALLVSGLRFPSPFLLTKYLSPVFQHSVPLAVDVSL